MDYALRSVLEGLFLIAVDSQEQKQLLGSSDFSPEEQFDFEALDFLPSQVENGAIPIEVADKIKTLYKQGEKTLKGFNWVQVDDFFSSDAEIVKEWRQRARSLLFEIEAHNKTLVWDGFTALRHPTV